MPLYVVCPNECRIRMPISRSGRIVRCPECKASIQVPTISQQRIKKGGQILCRASVVPDVPARSVETGDARHSGLENGRANSQADEILPTANKLQDSRGGEKHNIKKKRERLPVLDIAKSDRSPQSSFVTASVETQLIKNPSATNSSKKKRPKTLADINSASMNVRDVALDDRNWQQRLEEANADRRILTRFLAICLCFVAIVNMGPAIFYGVRWAQLDDIAPLPRWIYIQIFVGSVHLVYAIFLFQILDWAALRAVSIAMLIVAFLFGIVSTGLLIGGQGSLTQLLGIPYVLTRQASIWCVAMLCLSTLMSYWSGKESSNWQRAEDLLKEILSKQSAQA